MTRTFNHIMNLLKEAKQYANTKEWDFYRAYFVGFINASANPSPEVLSQEEEETLMKELRRIGGEFIG